MNINQDYNFNVVEALRQRNFEEVVNHCPVFMWHQPSNTTYIVTGIETRSNLKAQKTSYLIKLKHYEKRKHYCSCDDDDFAFGDETWTSVDMLTNKLIVDNLKLDEYQPAWQMTDKQHQALLNFGVEKELVNHMCGKEAWTLLNKLIEDAKQAKAHRKTMIEIDREDDDWFAYDFDVPNM